MQGNPRPDPILVKHNRFEEVGFLGAGQYGSVRRVLDKSVADPDGSGRPRSVAIKFFHRGPSTVNLNVWREIINHRQLLHPHIIEVEEVILTPSHLGIVMEYAPGGTLQNFINQQPNRQLTEQDARWFFQQFVIAMDYCHTMGVCNRDIKPANTLLTAGAPGQKPLIKLCDFGLSKSAAEGAMCTCVGTPDYMAPEVVLAGKNELQHGVNHVAYGREADVWSMGVLLCAMLSPKGRTPFLPRPNEPPNLTTLLQRILDVDYDLPSHISDDCRDLLQRIFKFEPAQRITIVDMFKHRWFAEGLPVEPRQMNAEVMEENVERLQAQPHLQTPEQIELIFREAQKPLGAALQQEPPEPYIGEQEVEASLLHSMNNPSWGWQDP